MAERLTNSYKEIPTLCDNAEYWLQVYFKLKDYEDLVEAGRLIIVPESFNVKAAIEGLSEHFCPPAFGINNFTEQCGLDNCKGCWEAALKGAEG